MFPLTLLKKITFVGFIAIHGELLVEICHNSCPGGDTQLFGRDNFSKYVRIPDFLSETDTTRGNTPF